MSVHFGHFTIPGYECSGRRRRVLIQVDQEVSQTGVVRDMSLPKVARQHRQACFEVLGSVLVVFVLWLTVPAPDLGLRFTQIMLGIVAITGVGLRRLCPRTAFLLALISTGAATVIGLTADPLLLAGVALNSVATNRGRRAFPPLLLGVVFGGLLLALFFGVDGAGDDMRGALFGGITLCGAWALGVKASEARRLAAVNATMEERMRLARDVHDVLSHSLGAIGVQAGVAAHIDGLSREQLRSTLRDVEQLSRSSITELKSLLSATRGMEDVAISTSTLKELLAETARTGEQSGVLISIEATGIQDLPVAHSATVHRVVQEAVSNTIRHSDATKCSITVRTTKDVVAIKVTDDGHGDDSDSPAGFGLRGMQERVNLLGGTFHAGNRQSGGFEVAVLLPLAKREDGNNE